MRWIVLLWVSTLGIVVHCKPTNQENENPSIDDYPKLTLLPYYGGAKGQSLQVTDLGNGGVTMKIIKNLPEQLQPKMEESPEYINESNNSENSPDLYSLDLSENLKLLQITATKIVQLEELSKKNGKLSEEEEETYKKNMSILNETASRLASIQEQSSPVGIENREGLSAWFERSKSNKSKNKKKDEEDRKKKEEEKKRIDEESRKKKKEEEDRKRKEEEQKQKEEKEEEEKKRKEEEKKRKGEKEGEEEEEIDVDDESVAVNLPPQDASVAEVKPVGLAIAGEGGVAASKPIGTAIVGPGGLAIARPVATAIAGVPPDEALIPLYGSVAGHKPSKSKDKTLSGSNYYISKLLKKYHEN